MNADFWGSFATATVIMLYVHVTAFMIWMFNR